MRRTSIIVVGVAIVSFALATTGYALARHLNRADADQALFAGMLHAVGKLFVLTRISRFPVLMRDPAIAAEIDTVWQARAARVLLARWDLPPEVVEATCDFDRAAAEREGPAGLADVLLAAHYLAGVRDCAELASATFLRASNVPLVSPTEPGMVCCCPTAFPIAIASATSAAMTSNEIVSSRPPKCALRPSMRIPAGIG